MEFIARLLTALLPVICMERSLFLLFDAPPKRWKKLILFLILHITITLPCWLGDANPIMLFPFFMLTFFLCLPGDKWKRLVTAGIFYSLFVSMNMLFDTLYLDQTTFLLTLLIKLGIWLILAWFFARIIPENGLQLSKQLWLLLGGLTLAPLMATLSFSIGGALLMWQNHYFTEEEKYVFFYDILKYFGFITLPFAWISALALLIAAVVLSHHETMEQENKLAALREVYYTGVKQEQTQLRTMRHDLRNHITAMQGLLEQGRQTEMEQYLANLSDSPALAGGRRYTRNETANVVISSKAAQMEAAGIIPDYQVQLPETLSLSAPELCALLGNALDNAIEGTEKNANNTILLRAKVERGVFMLQVQNPIQKTVHADLSTTKEDQTKHGYGLTGMQTIAKRHGGTLDAAVRDGRFELLVCFPCREY